MHRRDAANSSANRAAGALKPPLEERWRTGPLFTSGRRTVATSGETVFLTNEDLDATRSTLRARAASDGALRWEFSPADGTVEGTPAVVGDTVYAGGDALYAVAADDGSERFRFDTGEDFRPPVVAEGTVLVPGGRTLYALDAATGAQQWTFEANEELLNPPAVKNGVAYLATRRAVVALDVASGTHQWPQPGPSARLTAVYGGFVVTDSAGLTVLSASDGGIRWRLIPPGGTIITAPVVAGGRVFVLTESIINPEWDDGVHAYDLATGRRRWRRDIGASPFFERAAIDSLALGGNALYVGDVTGGVTALDPQTGRTRFRFDLDEPIVIMPVAVGDGLYLAGTSNDAAPGDVGALVKVVEADEAV